MPNYSKLRQQSTFRWNISSTYYSLMGVVDIPLEEVNLNANAMVELHRKGPARLKEMFGDDIVMPRLSTPAISYGHINCLGAELIFPEGGEVGYKPLISNLEEGIKLLRRDCDFVSAGRMPFYIDYQRKVSEAFGGQKCELWFLHEGPMTTAYTLRGQDVFFEPYDNPVLFKEFLRLLTESIIKFIHAKNTLNGLAAISTESGGICDDVASMFGASMWDEFVVPYINQYFDGITSGSRAAHIEDLKIDHLRYLEEISLSSYDPSISPKINPQIIYENCRVPFGWRLGAIHYPYLTVEEVRDFVFKAVADGASSVFTIIEASMCDAETAQKVLAFKAACKEVEAMLSKGADRSGIMSMVSAHGMQKFWENWP